MLFITTLAAVLRIYCRWIRAEAKSPVLGGFFSNPGKRLVSDLDQRDNSGCGEKCIGSGYILKVEPTGFSDHSLWSMRGKKGVAQNDSKTFGLGN